MDLDLDSVRPKSGVILAVMSYGYYRGRDDMSPGARGSVGRLRVVEDMLAMHWMPTKNLLAVFPQGASKDDPMAKHSTGLGQMMARAMQEFEILAEVPVVCQPMGFGTIDDVQNAVLLASCQGYTGTEIYFVSDPVHIQRVELIWNLLWKQDELFRNWTPHFIASPYHNMSFRERRILEPLKRLLTPRKIQAKMKVSEVV